MPWFRYNVSYVREKYIGKSTYRYDTQDNLKLVIKI